MDLTKADKLCAEHFDFWDKLTDAQRDTITSGLTYGVYPAGTQLQRAGENCLGLILVISGQIRVYILSEDGREVTLYRLYAGDTCILSASCVLDAVSFDVHIDTQSDTEIASLPASVFKKLSEENVYVQAMGYRLATERFSDVMWAMQQILFMGADKRLAIFLSDEIAKTGSDVISLTHEQVAKYMGTAREVVTRMLRYFADEKIVELSRGTIKIIDRKKLRELTR